MLPANLENKSTRNRGISASRSAVGAARSRLDSLAGGRVASHLRLPLYRNGYALTISAGLTSVVGFVYWLVAARFYTADVVGTNSAAIAAMTFLAGLSGLYLDGALVRFIPRAGAATVRLVGFAYGVTMLVAAIASGIFLFGLQVWSPNLGFLISAPWLTVGFAVATMAWCVFVEQDAALTGLRQAVWVPIENATYAAVKLALLIIFAAVLPAYGILVSWTVPAVMVIIPISLLIFRRLIPRHVQTTQNIALPIKPAQVARYAGANHIGVLFSLTYTILPPVMVLELAGSSASAYFYMPWMMASFLRIVATNMSASLTVEGALDETRLAPHFRHALISTLRLLIPVVALVVLTAPYLLGIFGDAYATDGASLLRLLALATIPNVVVMLYLGFLRVQNRIGGVIGVHGSIAVATLGLSYVWLRSYGIAGVGLAWLMSQTVMAVFLLLTHLRPILKRAPAVSRSGGAEEPAQ
jgi:O-antigen/teichoic acid export membrane protein